VPLFDKEKTDMYWLRLSMVSAEAIDGVGDHGADVIGTFAEDAVSEQWFHGFCETSYEVHFVIPTVRERLSFPPFR
jgi:hypothetical protein